MAAKLKANTKREQRTLERTVADAIWLEGLLRRAGAAVSPHEALSPATAGTPVPTPGSHVLASPALRARAEQITQKAQGLPVFPVAVAPLFSGWRLHTKSPHYDYVFCNLAEDPLFHDPDRFPIPRRLLDHLELLNRVGLGQEFDLLYVVHEVKKGTVREGEPLDPDRLVPPSPKVKRASKLLGTLGTGLWLGAAVPLLAGTGLGVLTAAMAMVPLGLDPLLLGAIVAPGRPVAAGETAVWFYLAHWQYADEEASR